tara:strand:- start:28122 stop:29561 length:1440 start_codon:yes stop_codon:yes gene_type:complete
MLKTTSQQLIDSLGYEGGRVGQPVVLGTAIDQAQGAKVLFSVPLGSVLLITHVISQIDSQAYLLGHTGSPGFDELLSQISLVDPDGTGRGGFTFRGFARNQDLFTQGGGTPDFRASQPGEIVSWRPKYMIPVPSGWSVQQLLNVIPWGNTSAVHGVLVTESAAEKMGYSTTATASPTTERRFGIGSSSGSVAGSDLVAARTGKSIHILDVNIRVQPESATSNTLTLRQADGTVIYRVINDNPAEGVDQSFSPGWYLKAGQALEIISDIEATNAVNVVYEFVEEDDVPGDVFFASVNPNVPTPNGGYFGTGGGLNNKILKANTEVTLYYAKPDASGSHTRTSPNKGFQHMLRGYALSIQKEGTEQAATDDTPQTRVCLSTGSAAGSVNMAAAQDPDLLQTNYQITPVFSASGHDTCTHGVVDGINIPCKKDDGSIWVDAIGLETVLGSPTNGTGGVRDWTINLWGRTVSAQFTDRTNEGT